MAVGSFFVLFFCCVSLGSSPGAGSRGFGLWFGRGCLAPRAGGRSLRVGVGLAGWGWCVFGGGCGWQWLAVVFFLVVLRFLLRGCLSAASQYIAGVVEVLQFFNRLNSRYGERRALW